MPTIHWREQAIEAPTGQSALDALLNAGVVIPNACRAGACQSCLVRASAGELPPQAQAGLRDDQRARGEVLACRLPVNDGLHLEPAGPLSIAGELILTRRVQPTESVAVLHLLPPPGLRPLAGQLLHLIREDGLSRPYSVASLPDDTLIELHVRQVPGGRMSTTLCDTAPIGARFGVRGPFGDCTLRDGEQDRPLLLVGVGTGLAPMLGLARDAYARGWRAPVTLIQAGLNEAALYQPEALTALTAAWPGLDWRRVVLQGPASDGVEVGDVVEAAKTSYAAAPSARVYLCGDAAVVNRLRRALFLAGASLSALHADPFTPTA
ncbi:MAG: 2Fe-2S iron-sulfur cluster binding domain-containing protein [Deltaproteobacteria bacterium]|nr:2Fe-2S iron-sulfur cluster binding domain-containing protein [Deltaproteobacteria bacterium]